MPALNCNQLLVGRRRGHHDFHYTPPPEQAPSPNLPTQWLAFGLFCLHCKRRQLGAAGCGEGSLATCQKWGGGSLTPPKGSGTVLCQKPAERHALTCPGWATLCAEQRETEGRRGWSPSRPPRSSKPSHWVGRSKTEKGVVVIPIQESKK